MTLQSKRWGLAVFICVLMASGLTWMNFNRTYPIPEEADPYAYVEVAQSLANGQGFQYGGQELTTWPPLYPILIFTVHFTGIPVMESVRILHTFEYGMIVILSALLLNRYLSDERLKVSGLLSIALSPALHFNAYVTMSELSFVMLSLLFFVALMNNKPSWFIGWLTALMILTRYAGIVFIPVALVYGWKQWTIKEKISFFALPMSFSGIWFAHNLYFNTLAGDRSAQNLWSIQSSITMFSDTFLWWIAQMLMISLLVHFAWLIMRWPLSHFQKKISPKVLLAMMTFVASYATLNIIFGSISDLQAIGQRIFGGACGAFILSSFMIWEQIPSWLDNLASATTFTHRASKISPDS